MNEQRSDGDSDTDGPRATDPDERDNHAGARGPGSPSRGTAHDDRREAAGAGAQGSEDGPGPDAQADGSGGTDAAAAAGGAPPDEPGRDIDSATEVANADPHEQDESGATEAEHSESAAGEGGAGGDAAGARAHGRGRALLVTAALIVALGAAAGAGYLGLRLERLERRVASIPDARAAALEPLAERNALERLERRVEQRLQEALEAKAEELAAARQEGLATLRERTATLEQGVREVRGLAARDQIGWRLAEIRYLLAIAQRRLLIARDTGSAIAALESADRAIAELGSVRLLPLRQRIVDDLAALRAIEPADVEGTALRLQNLLGRVDALPLQPAGADSRESAESGGGGWWARLGDQLDRFVRVRRRDAGPARGRPEPAGELPETDRLVLALERARQAALGRNPGAYERALEGAGEALEAGFARDADATRRFRAALDELRQRAVATDLPALDDTLALARRLSARLESEPRRTPTTGGEPTSDEPAKPSATGTSAAPQADEAGTADAGDGSQAAPRGGE